MLSRSRAKLFDECKSLSSLKRKRWDEWFFTSGTLMDGFCGFRLFRRGCKLKAGFRVASCESSHLPRRGLHASFGFRLNILLDSHSDMPAGRMLAASARPRPFLHVARHASEVSKNVLYKICSGAMRLPYAFSAPSISGSVSSAHKYLVQKIPESDQPLLAGGD